MAQKATTTKTAPKKTTGAKKPPAAGVKHIAEDLRPLAVPVSSLTTDPRNANKHDERSLAEIRKSLDAHGQVKPIVVDKHSGKIIAGNGTFEAFQAIGWEWIAVVHMDADQAQQTAYGIRDNRTAQFSEWDAAELSSLIEDLDIEGITAEGLGFTASEIDDLVNSALQAAEATTEGSTDSDKPATSGGSPHPQEPAGDQTDQLTELWQVLVTCEDEADQRAFLEKCSDEGRTAKALNT